MAQRGCSGAKRCYAVSKHVTVKEPIRKQLILRHCLWLNVVAAVSIALLCGIEARDSERTNEKAINIASRADARL